MSDWMTRSTNRSRLGQILIEKKLISQEQLDAAIRAQEQSGRRLGEILADMKLITQAQVRGAVRRQRSLRMAAALATALLGPLHAYAAVAAAPAAAVSTRLAGESGREFGRGMRALSDEELGEVTAQGRNDDALRDQARQAELRLIALAAQGGQQGLQAAVQHALPNDGVRVLGELATVFNPLALLLSADTTVRDVRYDPANSHATVNKDGSITLRLPSTIGEISFRNIRVGSHPGPTFGSIEIHDIDLRGTTISVKPIGH
ncbi:hypothetical protein SAMN05428966_112206 [Massilia sp. PDC64]|nr:hypothetical protein [Massilia sp. PDC64]SDF09152.1 hypothetical protein SAMN05428966_112206 [Massilia sp. PDC64]